MTDTTDLARSKDTPQLDRRIDAAAAALRAAQRSDGHWVFELEADATIPAEYVLFTHYLGEEPNLGLERKIGVYLRSRQQADGGWPLFHNGAFDISASVKAYFALKMIGDYARHAAHAQGARGDPRARRRRRSERVHSLSARPLRQSAVVGRAADAGRDHAAAALVFLPSVEDFLLGPHSFGAASGAAGDQAAGAQQTRRAHR